MAGRANEWRRQLDAGEVPYQAASARRECVTQSRISQFMAMI